MQRTQQRKKKQDEDVEGKPYTTVDKDGRVVWEPGLPAMVTARRQHKPQKKVDPEEAPVSCELKSVLKMSSEAKPDWLYKALKAVPKGRAQIQDVYNAVTHPKFTSGVKEWHGQRMLRMIKDHIDLFSEKQHKTLTVRCDLAAQFRSPTPSRSPPRRANDRRSPSLSVPRGEDLLGDDGSLAADGAASSREPPAEETPEEREQRLRTQRERIARAMKEREQQRIDENRRQQQERQKQEEKERQRKQKLGGAFKLDDDEDDEPVRAPSLLALTKRGDGQDRATGSDLARPGSKNSNPQFVEAMGGDKVLHEVHALLMQKVAPENRGLAKVRQSDRDDSRSASRSPRAPAAARRQRSRSPKRTGGRGLTSSGSLRSPTPDGRARGQARAARKAKMIAACLGMQGLRRPGA